jgi:Zn ribbon nucleic-acid-binding protein
MMKKNNKKPIVVSVSPVMYRLMLRCLTRTVTENKLKERADEMDTTQEFSPKLKIKITGGKVCPKCSCGMIPSHTVNDKLQAFECLTCGFTSSNKKGRVIKCAGCHRILLLEDATEGTDGRMYCGTGCPQFLPYD